VDHSPVRPHGQAFPQFGHVVQNLPGLPALPIEIFFLDKIEKSFLEESRRGVSFAGLNEYVKSENKTIQGHAF
jgi:hypothetical protein